MSLSRSPGVAVLAMALAACASAPGPAAPAASAVAPARSPVEPPSRLAPPSSLGPERDAADGSDAAVDAGRALRIPDVELVDRKGRSVRLRELLGDDVFAMNFVFTTCRTICPPLTANFARVQDELGDALGDGVRLVSVSIDPVNDTPPRLDAWADEFGAGEHWSFLTGEKNTVDGLLKALGVFTPLKVDHAPLALVGDASTGRFERMDGLTPPATIARALLDLRRERATAAEEPFVNASAHAYFGDVELVDQHGETHRLYADLIRGRTVVIDSFFASCTGVCPVLARNMGAIQDDLGERLGDDVILMSVSVDPSEDTPPRLAHYASSVGAKHGWYFLTGPVPQVREALHKLGFAVEEREQHSNVIVVGNDRTGLWKKARGLAEPQEVVEIVRSVVEDDGS